MRRAQQGQQKYHMHSVYLVHAAVMVIRTFRPATAVATADDATLGMQNDDGQLQQLMSGLNVAAPYAQAVLGPLSCSEC